MKPTFVQTVVELPNDSSHKKLIQGVPKQADIFKSLILVITNYHDKFNFEEEYITFDILVDLMSFFQ